MLHRDSFPLAAHCLAAGVWENLNAVSQQQAIELLVKLALKRIAHESALSDQQEFSCLITPALTTKSRRRTSSA